MRIRTMGDGDLYTPPIITPTFTRASNGTYLSPDQAYSHSRCKRTGIVCGLLALDAEIGQLAAAGSAELRWGSEVMRK